MSDEALAHAGLAALTALISIEDSPQVGEGETILIEGAAGGVGGFAVQIACERGACVLATAWRGNHAYVRSLGADHVVDPGDAGFGDLRSQCDAVLQTVGGSDALRAFEVLKPGGRAAFLGSGLSAPPAPSASFASLRPNIARSGSNLDRVAAGDGANGARATYDCAARLRPGQVRHASSRKFGRSDDLAKGLDMIAATPPSSSRRHRCA